VKPERTRKRANPEDLPAETGQASVKQVWLHYGASMAVYGCLLILLTFNPWFANLLSVSYRGFKALHLYYWAFVAYAVLAPVIYLAMRPGSLRESKNLLIVGYFGRLFRLARGVTAKAESAWRPQRNEGHALVFLLIKLMFGPLMLNSAFLELQRFAPLQFFLKASPNYLSTFDFSYKYFVACIFFLDAVIFFIGYHTEAGFLRNRLRRPETNWFRILVCIACYPPFNLVTINVFGASYYDYYILFKGDLDHPMTWVLRILAVLALLGMLATELSLFTKASNLTNRGIVTWGPYAIIRHPGYLAKNIFWLITLLPAFVPNTGAADFSWWRYGVWCAATLSCWLGWPVLYFLRAITEEQFLMSDPDYVAYCQKVRYRFIPGVY
jgi:protein-S-isoprenylcysteine O-methyltransferase Ste14